MPSESQDNDKSIQEQFSSELEWIAFREHTLGSNAYESSNDGIKLLQKFKENPLVPIGALATVGALGYGLISFRRGNSKMSNTMMRARIAAQGFTLVALIGGILFGISKPKSMPNNKSSDNG